MLLILLIGASALLASSASLRTACAGTLEAGWDFANFWLRIVIASMIIWPTLMIAVAAVGPQGHLEKGWGNSVPSWILVVVAVVFLILAAFALRLRDAAGYIVAGISLAMALAAASFILIKGTEVTLFSAQAVVLVMMFIPVFAVFCAAVAIDPLLWAVPAGINFGAGSVEAISKSLENLIRISPGLSNAQIALTLPRVPPLKKFLWPIALFLIADLLLGSYLCAFSVSNDRVLLAILVAVSIVIALLSVFDKAKGLQRLLRFAAVAMTLIICLGGRSEAVGKVSKAGDKLSSFFPHLQSGTLVPTSAPRTPTRCGIFGGLKPMKIKIELQEGCLAGPFYLPDSWRSWRKQRMGHNPDWWVARQYPGGHVIGPVGPDADLDDGYPPKKIYLEGKAGESILFKRTDR